MFLIYLNPDRICILIILNGHLLPFDSYLAFVILSACAHSVQGESIGIAYLSAGKVMNVFVIWTISYIYHIHIFLHPPPSYSPSSPSHLPSSSSDLVISYIKHAITCMCHLEPLTISVEYPRDNSIDQIAITPLLLLNHIRHWCLCAWRLDWFSWIPVNSKYFSWSRIIII